MQTKTILVIGGGAAGMMAAISAARTGARVTMIEKNAELGRKLSISGGGRCNIWNEEEDPRELLSYYNDSAKFLHSAFSVFGMSETKQFFVELGLATKVEVGKRAFPITEKASDVVRVLTDEISRLKISVVRGDPVTSVKESNGQIESVTLSNGKVLECDAVILSTGGMSRPETGSTGDGFGWLESLGHTIVEPTPNITPLSANADWLELVAGTALKGARISFYTHGKKEFSVDGDILLTHFGLSGPIILNSAYKVADLLHDDQVSAKIDSLPGEPETELNKTFIALLEKYPAKQVKNVLREFVPNGLLPVVFAVLGEEMFAVKTSEFSKKSREALLSLLKNLPLEITGLLGFEKAVVADGGVPLSEIDTRTFRSLKVDNLYIVGDLLHIRRPSGGYSLQLCWTSGYVAGLSQT